MIEYMKNAITRFIFKVITKQLVSVEDYLTIELFHKGIVKEYFKTNKSGTMYMTEDVTVDGEKYTVKSTFNIHKHGE